MLVALGELLEADTLLRAALAVEQRVLRPGLPNTLSTAAKLRECEMRG